MSLSFATLQASDLRFADGQENVFSGYGARWGMPDAYGDTIKKGAFAKSLKGRKPAMLWQHNSSEPIGLWTEALEDEKGLRLTGQILTETTRGREAIALLRAKVIDGLSIGFRAVRTERGPNGGRVVAEIELWEVSLVTFPAAAKARVDSVRAASADTAAFTEAVRRAAASIRGNR